MVSLILATLFLSLVHGLIPNHWLPLVAVARAQNWPKRDLVLFGMISVLSHILGTIALGIILGIIGIKLNETYEHFAELVAPVLLIVLGLVYFSLNAPHHHHSESEDLESYKKNRKRWLTYFILLMFLSPCLEVEALFFPAGQFGLPFVFLLALVYAIGSVASIMTLLMIAFRSSHLIKGDFIEHNEKRITGVILILVGILTFFIH